MKKILLLTLIFSGCSTRPIHQLAAPNSERLELIKSMIEGKSAPFPLSSPSEELAKLFLEAKKLEVQGSADTACKIFSLLSKNEAFPLNQTALVHSLINCSFSNLELKTLWEKTKIEGYLKETYLQQSILQAKRLNIEEAVAEFSYELSALKQVQSEKVQLLETASTIAKKLELSDKVEKYFKRLSEVSPRNIKIISPENIYMVAKDFESHRMFDKARELYLQIINGDFALEEKIKAYNSYRTTFKIARDLKNFLQKTSEMEVFLKNLLDLNPEDTKIQEAWVDAKINFARAIWTDHQNYEARIILDDIIEKNLGTQNQLATLFWIYGSLHIESKEIIEGLEKYKKASSFKISVQKLEEEIQWAIAWNNYQLKNDTDAISAMDLFIKKSNNNNFIFRLQFWKAKALARLGRLDEAKALFESITIKDHFGYYGLVSALETKTILPALPPSQIINAPLGHLVLDWLIAVDEKTLAAKVLKEINSQFKTIAERERAMSLYAQTDWHQGGMAQIYNFPMRSQVELTKKYISVVFPTPYNEIVNKISSKYQVPKALVYAITRQESAFNPNIRSWADAFGLMQMIPEKAQELSTKYNIPYRNYSDLYLPALNIEMGTALLSDLRAFFKSKFIPSVASYNASTDVIAVWERERFNGNYLEFIEMIPYEETRNYIKLVFRNFFIYKRVLEKNDILIPENFFEVPFN